MTFRAGFSFVHFLQILDPETARKFQSVRPKKLIFSAHFEARELSYPIMTFPGTFWNLQNLESSVPGAPILRCFKSDFSTKSAKGAWFKTVKNHTSRRPPESTQEVLNSLLAMCSSHFEPFSTMSAQIPKFIQGSSWGRGPAQSRTPHVPPPTGVDAWIEKY